MAIGRTRPLRGRRSPGGQLTLAVLLLYGLTMPDGIIGAQRGPLRPLAQQVPDSIVQPSTALPNNQTVGRSQSTRPERIPIDRKASTSASETSGRPQQVPQPRAITSVRPRGAQAPFVKLEPKLEQNLREPDRSASIRQVESEGRTKRTTEPGRERSERDGRRVWPLKSGSYTFTQPFGCVPQIGNLYQPDLGCPGNSPVVHTGIDLAAPLGTRFYAAAAGWVTEAGYDRTEGLANTRMIVQHDGGNDGYATEYLHWITTFVKVGDYVEAGDPLGEVGSVGYSTGPHLHFAVIDFEDGSQLDPVEWLPRDQDSGTYAGVAPGASPRRFRNVSIDLPDYADPSPPPLPTPEAVSERTTGKDRRERGRDEDRANEDRGRDDRGGRKKRDREQGASGEEPRRTAEERQARQEQKADRAKEPEGAEAARADSEPPGDRDPRRGERGGGAEASDTGAATEGDGRRRERDGGRAREPERDGGRRDERPRDRGDGPNQDAGSGDGGNRDKDRRRADDRPRDKDKTEPAEAGTG